jgi:phosphoribosylformylglycinamidine cyclo-ligase
MFTTFNCGVGMLLIVAAEDVDSTLAALREQGEAPVEIGAIVAPDHKAASGQIIVR